MSVIQQSNSSKDGLLKDIDLANNIALDTCWEGGNVVLSVSDEIVRGRSYLDATSRDVRLVETGTIVRHNDALFNPGPRRASSSWARLRFR